MSILLGLIKSKLAKQTQENNLIENNSLTEINAISSKIFAYLNYIFNIQYIKFGLDLNNIRNVPNPFIYSEIAYEYVINNNVLYNNTYNYDTNKLEFTHVNNSYDPTFNIENVKINNYFYAIDKNGYMTPKKYVPEFIYFTKDNYYTIKSVDRITGLITPFNWYFVDNPPHSYYDSMTESFPKKYPGILNIININALSDYPKDLNNKTLLDFHQNILAFSNNIITINNNNFLTNNNYYINGKKYGNIKIGDMFICLESILIRNYNNFWFIINYINP